MTVAMAVVLVLVVLALVALIFEWGSPDLVSLSVFAALVLLPVPPFGDRTAWLPILERDLALAVFANPAVITVGALFVLAQGLERTGSIDVFGRMLGGVGGVGEVGTLVALLVPAMILSAFINDTPVVVMMVPIALRMAQERGIKPTRLLVPLSFAALFGGMCTLIGTSTNILVSGLAEGRGDARAFGMFELAWVGVPVGLLGIGYILIARRILPAEETVGTRLQRSQVKEYLIEVVVKEESPYAGRGLDALGTAGRDDVRILEIVRGGEALTQDLDEVELETMDRLLLSGPADLADDLRRDPGLRFPGAREEAEEREASLMEAVVAPGSRIAGSTVRDLRFRQRYGAAILAIHRHGRSLRTNLGDVRFRFGDTLLLLGTEGSVDRLQDTRDFLLISEVETQSYRRERAPIALGLMAGVVIGAAFGLKVSMLALAAGAGLMVTRCLEPREAYDAVRWDILFLIFGMLALGQAMEVTGAAQWVADAALTPVQPFGGTAVLAVVMGLTILLTCVLTNNAAVVLMVPIASAVALDMGLSVQPFMIAVALAGSASFATPIGYQTNTYVFGIGNYRFVDFVKFGGPLTILVWIASILIIPRVWPLHP